MLSNRIIASAVRATTSSSSLTTSVITSVATSFSLRAFGHGRDQYAANGSERFKKHKAAIHPLTATKKERAEHKMKRLLITRARIQEKNRAQAVASRDAAADSSSSSSSSSTSDDAATTKLRKVDKARQQLGIVPVKDMSPQEREAFLAKHNQISQPEGISTSQYRFGIKPYMVQSLPQPIKQMLSYVNANSKEVLNQRKANWVSSFGKHEADSGSASVQVCILTERIKNLTDHMRLNHKDMRSRRGLEFLVHRRRKMMWYLRRQDFALYNQVLEKLSLSDLPPPLQP